MKRFKDILYVVDPENVSKPILERAVSLAENNQASLTVVSVVERVASGIVMPKGRPLSADLRAATVDSQTQELAALVKPFHKRVKVETKVLLGIPFLEIIREVVRNGRDLLIKIPEHQDWLDRSFASDDMHLLRKCPCPVWLIKPQASKTYPRILAAVDVGDVDSPQESESQGALNRQILELASSLALAESGDLHIVHAWDAIGESTMRHGAFMRMPEEEVDTYVEQARQQHSDNLNALLHDVATGQSRDALDYLKPQTHLMKGWARKVIPLLIKDIEVDLVVMGTVARTGVPGFIMGNTAETILNQIDCSVLAIKPSGFITPVTRED